MQQKRLTKRALDGWDSAPFSGFFYTRAESCSQSFVHTRPPASNANRWAAPCTTKRDPLRSGLFRTQFLTIGFAALRDPTHAARHYVCFGLYQDRARMSSHLRRLRRFRAFWTPCATCFWITSGNAPISQASASMAASLSGGLASARPGRPPPRRVPCAMSCSNSASASSTMAVSLAPVWAFRYCRRSTACADSRKVLAVFIPAV